MIEFNLCKMAFILNAKHIGIDVIISNVSINSNIIGKQCMFVALIGKRFNGHDFAEQAVIKGAKAILVNSYLPLDIPQLIVLSTQDALMKMAHWVRCQVSSKIIAITGSSGKTSVKEMTSSILKNLGTVISTQKNYNNAIGVSMTLLSLTDKTNFAVVELGTSNIGELYQLSKIVAADVAIINNIFPAHLSGFRSLTAIKKEKGKIFDGMLKNGNVVINADNHAYSIWRLSLTGKDIWWFSLSKKINVNFFASNIWWNKNGIRFVLNTPCGRTVIFLSMLGLHNVVNAIAASALSFVVGASLCDITTGLHNVNSLPGRLFPISLNKGKLLLLDDTYNSNVGSMVSAIYVLSNLVGYRILITSDMSELGISTSIKYHQYIGKLILKTNIDQVLTIGSFSYFISQTCKRGKHFQSKFELINYLNEILFQSKYVSLLVKGSRNFCMEEIVNTVKRYTNVIFQ